MWHPADKMQFVKELGMLKELRVLSTSIKVTSESSQRSLPASPGNMHNKSRYNNGLIAKLMLMWRRKGRKEMRAWLPCKHQAGHESIGINGPK
jgi:hypothetical protein